MKYFDLDSRLAALVRPHKLLYDTNTVFFDVKHIKIQLWEDIAVKMNLGADKCRNRWHCLRDKFRRLHRDATIWALERGVDISQINMNSKYYDLLSFLAEFMQPHKLSNMIEKDEMTQFSADEEDSSSPPSAFEQVFLEVKRKPSTATKNIDKTELRLPDDKVEKKHSTLVTFTKDVNGAVAAKSTQNARVGSKLFVRMLEQKMRKLPAKERLAMEVSFLDQINTRLRKLQKS